MPRMTSRVSVGVTLLWALAAACTGEDPKVLGPQTSSGLVRLSDDSFGLLIYPCVADHLVSEVVLLEVEFDPATLKVVRSQALLRERYREPVAPRDLVVSTAPTAAAARPDAERQIIDLDSLNRFNNDRNYLTAVEPLRFLTIDAFSPDGNEVGGTGTLQDRFSADVGEISGFGPSSVPIDEVRCPGSAAQAWSVSAPT
jgi:hypothetical protein